MDVETNGVGRARELHLVPTGQGWALIEAGSERPIGVFGELGDALDTATAAPRLVRLVVHGGAEPAPGDACVSPVAFVERRPGGGYAASGRAVPADSLGCEVRMADLKETQQRHAQDVVTGNMAGLMGDFTPAAMAKVMALAANPITATRFEVKDLGNNEAQISYIGDKTRVIWSKWVENGGKWQIDDVKEVTAS
jgi:hypothetical protein